MATLHGKLAAAGEAPRKAWWWEMVAVDLRHTAFIWVLYVASSIALTGTTATSAPIWLIPGLLLSGGGVVAQMLSSDMSHGTLSALLSFPRSRVSLLICRVVLLTVLMFLPIAVGGIWVAEDTTTVVLAGWLASIQFGFGLLFAMMVSKKPLVWSATTISPFLVVIVLQVVSHVLGLERDSSFREDFPYMDSSDAAVMAVLWVGAVLGATLLWMRKEVKS